MQWFRSPNVLQCHSDSPIRSEPKEASVKHFYNDYCTHLTSKQSEVNETFNVNDTLWKMGKDLDSKWG